MNKKRVEKKNLINIIIFILIIIASFILAKYKNEIKKLSFFSAKGKLLDFVLPIVLAIIPIVIAISIFVYQLYYNRYTIPIFKKNIKSKFQWLLLLLTSEIICIFLFWFFNEKINFFYFTTIFLLIDIILEFSCFLFCFSKYTIENCVNKYTEQCKKIIVSDKIDSNEIKTIFHNINEYFTESIEKKENNYIRIIIASKKEILCTYIQNKNRHLLNSHIKQSEHKEIIKIFLDSIQRDYHYLLINNVSNKIMSVYSSEILGILKECTLCEDINLYKQILSNLEKLFFYNDIESKSTSFIVTIFYKLHSYLLNNKDYKEYRNELEDFVLKLYKASNHIMDNTKLKSILFYQVESFLFDLIEYNLTEEFEEKLKIIIDEIKIRIRFFTKDEIEILGILLQDVLNYLEKNNNSTVYNMFLNSLFNFLDICLYFKNEEIISVLSYFYQEILKLSNFCNDGEFEKKEITQLTQCLKKMPSKAILFYPNYLERIEKNKKVDEYVKKVSQYFSDIFTSLYSINSEEYYYFFLVKLNKIIVMFDKNEKDKQTFFIDIYEEIFTLNLNSDSYKVFNVILFAFFDLLEELDSNRKISDALMFYIFDVFDSIGRKLFETENIKLQNYFLDKIRNLSEIIPLIEKNKNYKRKIVEIIFHFAVDMLEEKNEKSLKVCSSELGWFAIDMEKSGDLETYSIAIDYAVSMYTLAVDQDLDKTLIAFIGTLFIIVGAFGKYKNDTLFIEAILKRMKGLARKDCLKIAKKFRYLESQYWEPILGNKAKQHISDFYNKIDFSEKNK